MFDNLTVANLLEEQMNWDRPTSYHHGPHGNKLAPGVVVNENYTHDYHDFDGHHSMGYASPYDYGHDQGYYHPHGFRYQPHRFEPDAYYDYHPHSPHHSQWVHDQTHEAARKLPTGYHFQNANAFSPEAWRAQHDIPGPVHRHMMSAQQTEAPATPATPAAGNPPVKPLFDPMFHDSDDDHHMPKYARRPHPDIDFDFDDDHHWHLGATGKFEPPSAGMFGSRGPLFDATTGGQPTTLPYTSPADMAAATKPFTDPEEQWDYQEGQLKSSMKWEREVQRFKEKETEHEMKLKSIPYEVKGHYRGGPQADFEQQEAEFKENMKWAKEQQKWQQR